MGNDVSTGQEDSIPDTTAGHLIINDVQITAIHDLQVPVTTDGQIKQMAAKVGDQIEPGQVLATLFSEESQHATAAAELEVELNDLLRNDQSAVKYSIQQIEMTRTRRDRLIGLRQRSSGSVSTERLEDVRLAHEEAVASLANAQNELRAAAVTFKIKNQALALQRERLAKHTVKSPQSGVLVEIYFQPGEWVNQGDNLMRIVDTTKVRVEAFVDANKIDRNWSGCQAQFLPRSSETTETAKQLTGGRVIFVSPIVQPVTSQVPVWVEFDNTDQQVRPGQRGVLEILPPKTNGTDPSISG
ncbi:MAG: efflux RND transporter periplasmic adaptor subunit [Pirellulaceae bacterium]